MKKNLQNKLCLALALVLLTGSLSGCGVPGVSNETTEAPTIEQTDASTTDEPTMESTEEPTDEPTVEETFEWVDTPELPEDSILSSLPKYTYDPYKNHWDMENTAEMLLYSAVNSDGYTQYLTDLQTAGFTLYAENEIAGNLFSTWTSEDVHVTMMFLPSQKSVRILAESSSIGLPTREEDNVYTDAGVEPLLVQMGTAYTSSESNGMCHIYRLCDGSFIIVDGGFNQKVCGDEIYNILTKLAPDPENIVIAAWFITHAHGDHVGGFYQFTDNYVSGNSNITLEQFIYNYPTEMSFTATDVSTNHIAKVATYTAKYPNAVKVIEAHAGQKYYIRDAEIEMLFAMDIFNMNYVSFMNNSSLVFSVTLGDTRIMVTGDNGPLAAPIIEACYGNYVDCDIVQVAHHGSAGSSASLNALYQPEVVLWPTLLVQFAFRSTGQNEVFLEAPHQIVADSSAWLIPLPFDETTVESWKLYE